MPSTTTSSAGARSQSTRRRVKYVSATLGLPPCGARRRVGSRECPAARLQRVEPSAHATRGGGPADGGSPAFETRALRARFETSTRRERLCCAQRYCVRFQNAAPRSSHVAGARSHLSRFNRLVSRPYATRLSTLRPDPQTGTVHRMNRIAHNPTLYRYRSLVRSYFYTTLTIHPIATR